MYVVVRESSAVLELLAGEDETLLVWRNTAQGELQKIRESQLLQQLQVIEEYRPLLILDLGLDIIYGVTRFNLERDSFTREGLHEDLHLTVAYLSPGRAT